MDGIDLDLIRGLLAEWHRLPPSDRSQKVNADALCVYCGLPPFTTARVLMPPEHLLPGWRVEVRGEPVAYLPKD